MNKSFPTKFLAGLVIGVGIAWLVFRHTAPAAASPADEKSAGAPAAGGESAAESKVSGNEIAEAAPRQVRIAPEVKGYGRVLDSSPLVALAGDAAAARSAADASSRELARVKALHDEGENASAQAVEAAAAAMERDSAQLLAAQARLIAGWGREAASRPDLGSLVHALAAGESALVRIDLPPGEMPAAVPGSSRVAALAGEGGWHEVQLLGRAPVTDAQAQDSSYLAAWRDHPLPAGTALRATLAAPGPPRIFLEVPRSALIRHNGATFVYAKTDKGGYERRLVDVASTLPDGIAIASGLSEKDRIVVTGAQQLLAAELLGPAGGEGEN